MLNTNMNFEYVNSNKYERLAMKAAVSVYKICSLGMRPMADVPYCNTMGKRRDGLFRYYRYYFFFFLSIFL